MPNGHSIWPTAAFAKFALLFGARLTFRPERSCANPPDVRCEWWRWPFSLVWRGAPGGVRMTGGAHGLRRQTAGDGLAVPVPIAMPRAQLTGASLGPAKTIFSLHAGAGPSIRNYAFQTFSMD